MKLRSLLLLAATLTLFAAPAHAWHGGGTRVNIGIGIGVPIGGYYGPYYRGYYPYGYPYPYAYPAPIVVSPAPVVVQQPPVVIGQPPPPGYYYGTQPPANPGTVPPMPPITNSDGNVNTLLSQLSQSDANVRQSATIELGRMRSDRAVEPLTAVLGGDMSPQVRDAAARSLGLIASPRALNALTRAAQADNDRDVRRSAQYAIEIINSHSR
jgi:HEAT repeats